MKANKDAVNSATHRLEKDSLGELPVPAEALYGIHTERARQNFVLAKRPVHPELIIAFGVVKEACARANQQIGVWQDAPEKSEAIIRACSEVASGLLSEHVIVDALQGGAGTSTNMNVNEIIANRALQLLEKAPGRYDLVSPLEDINRHQSTNDTFPTALKLAVIRLIHRLEGQLKMLHDAFCEKAQQFDGIIKMGRTEFQDAVLTTLGQTMGAFAAVVQRDCQRMGAAEAALLSVNLGGTAIGTGFGAPPPYLAQVVDHLKELSGLEFSQAENLVDATQNADAFIEVSGLLKTCASSLLKIATDLRVMSSGPNTGIGEINLPPMQAGSSIMPGKVNPVIPEAVSQVAFLIMGYDLAITQACARGDLELNAFLPLTADCLLYGIDLLVQACQTLRTRCVQGITANEERCKEQAKVALSTASILLPVLGYEGAHKAVKDAAEKGVSLRDHVIEAGYLDAAGFNALMLAEAAAWTNKPKVESKEKEKD